MVLCSRDHRIPLSRAYFHAWLLFLQLTLVTDCLRIERQFVYIWLLVRFVSPDVLGS